MSAIGGEFVVEKVLSELERGCIFTVRNKDGVLLNVKHQWAKGMEISPVVGDTYVVRGTLTTYVDKWKKTHPQILAVTVVRSAPKDDLMQGWLERLHQFWCGRFLFRCRETFPPEHLSHLGSAAHHTK